LCHNNSPRLLLRYFEIIPSHKGLYSVSNKINGIKIGLQLYNLWQFTDSSWIEELQTRKHLSPIWASSSTSRKQQATSFGPLCHKYLPSFS